MDMQIVAGYAEIEETTKLFLEYQAWLGEDLTFQYFTEELETLPGKYAPPEGRLFLALSENEFAGCVALRKISEKGCEMKRLFLREKYRGNGLGRKMAQKIIAEARTAGYEYMLLDTLESMKGAVGLYRSLGFKEVEPYYFNPLKNTLYFRLDFG